MQLKLQERNRKNDYFSFRNNDHQFHLLEVSPFTKNVNFPCISSPKTEFINSMGQVQRLVIGAPNKDLKLMALECS